MSYSIAIDGPAGAGKSTIAKRIAKELSFIYVDTGAMYRAMALHFIKKGIDPSDGEKIAAECARADISIEYRNGEQVVLLDGEDVTDRLRTEEAGKMASATSVYPQVRRKLVELQRKLAASANVVMDGRDIGTCVLPGAQLKIYLTASAHTRAERRYAELRAKGEHILLETIEQDIMDRDARDMNREYAPLRQAEDAVLIDSSDLTIEEVVEKILELAGK